jgi:hypothetical protein
MALRFRSNHSREHVRASILLWSTASGTLLGLFVDATLIGLVVLASLVVPGLSSRMHHRWFATSSIVVLAAVPAVFAVLGFLEGQLKTR